MMKKNFKFYFSLWSILLAVFNVVVFILRPVIPGYIIEYDARFWIAWGFILAAFIVNLVCAYFAFRAENLKKLFYSIPLITVSRSGLIVLMAVGSALMLIPGCPAWITAIVCIVIFAFNAAAVIKAKAAGDIASDVNDKVKAQTAFIKTASANAQSIVNEAGSDAVRAECKKVYEALRYSDPVSDISLFAIESDIAEKLKALEIAVRADDPEGTAALSGVIIVLTEKRSQRCRALK